MEWFWVALIMAGSLAAGYVLSWCAERLPRYLTQKWRTEALEFVGVDAAAIRASETPSMGVTDASSQGGLAQVEFMVFLNKFSFGSLGVGRLEGDADKRYSLSWRNSVCTGFIAIGFLLLVAQFDGVRLAAAFVFCWALVLASRIDSDFSLLPDIVTLPLLWLGLFLNSFELFVPLSEAVWAVFIAYGVAYVIHQISAVIFRRRLMGAGDFKFFAAIAAWLGTGALPALMLWFVVFSSAFAVIYLATGEGEFGDEIPYGPFIGLAAWVVFCVQTGETVVVV